MLNLTRDESSMIVFKMGNLLKSCNESENFETEKLAELAQTKIALFAASPKLYNEPITIDLENQKTKEKMLITLPTVATIKKSANIPKTINSTIIEGKNLPTVDIAYLEKIIFLHQEIADGEKRIKANGNKNDAIKLAKLKMDLASYLNQEDEEITFSYVDKEFNKEIIIKLPKSQDIADDKKENDTDKKFKKVKLEYIEQLFEIKYDVLNSQKNTNMDLKSKEVSIEEKPHIEEIEGKLKAKITEITADKDNELSDYDLLKLAEATIALHVITKNKEDIVIHSGGKESIAIQLPNIETIKKSNIPKTMSETIITGEKLATVAQDYLSDLIKIQKEIIAEEKKLKSNGNQCSKDEAIKLAKLKMNLALYLAQDITMEFSCTDENYGIINIRLPKPNEILSESKEGDVKEVNKLRKVSYGYMKALLNNIPENIVDLKIKQAQTAVLTDKTIIEDYKKTPDAKKQTQTTELSAKATTEDDIITPPANQDDNETAIQEEKIRDEKSPRKKTITAISSFITATLFQPAKDRKKEFTDIADEIEKINITSNDNKEKIIETAEKLKNILNNKLIGSDLELHRNEYLTHKNHPSRFNALLILLKYKAQELREELDLLNHKELSKQIDDKLDSIDREAIYKPKNKGVYSKYKVLEQYSALTNSPKNIKTKNLKEKREEIEMQETEIKLNKKDIYKSTRKKSSEETITITNNEDDNTKEVSIKKKDDKKGKIESTKKPTKTTGNSIPEDPNEEKEEVQEHKGGWSDPFTKGLK